MRSDLGESEFEARYRALREEYLSLLPQRRDAVAAHWQVCAQDAACDDWRELHSLAHKLSGSAPCYGLDEIGAAAHEIDRVLSAKPSCRDFRVLAPLVAHLLTALNAGIAAG